MASTKGKSTSRSPIADILHGTLPNEPAKAELRRRAAAFAVAYPEREGDDLPGRIREIFAAGMADAGTVEQLEGSVVLVLKKVLVGVELAIREAERGSAGGGGSVAQQVEGAQERREERDVVMLERSRAEGGRAGEKRKRREGEESSNKRARSEGLAAVKEKPKLPPRSLMVKLRVPSHSAQGSKDRAGGEAQNPPTTSSHATLNLSTTKLSTTPSSAAVAGPSEDTTMKPNHSIGYDDAKNLPEERRSAQDTSPSTLSAGRSKSPDHNQDCKREPSQPLQPPQKFKVRVPTKTTGRIRRPTLKARRAASPTPVTHLIRPSAVLHHGASGSLSPVSMFTPLPYFTSQKELHLFLKGYDIAITNIVSDRKDDEVVTLKSIVATLAKQKPTLGDEDDEVKGKRKKKKKTTGKDDSQGIAKGATWTYEAVKKCTSLRPGLATSEVVRLLGTYVGGEIGE